MARLIKMFSVMVFIFITYGCEKESQKLLAPSEQTGKIVINVTWPQSAYSTKKADTYYEVSKITAYLYLSGKEITNIELTHEGNQGKADIEVPAFDNYRLELIASQWYGIVYVGFEENINVIANETTTVNITMVDAVQTLYSAEMTGENSFTISWSSVLLATSYRLEENTTGDFSSSINVYSGADTNVTFAGKTPGIYT